ncbi:MAG: peptidyl-prolyl cis-trans isomerase [Oscillospiraceae bacterium]|nr:peptidyl-prolyl cis-trans isomerase [Oscillospiraceae bacterium]
MSKDKNQKQEAPEEKSYKGILGDYQEKSDSSAKQTDTTNSVSEPKKSNKALKIASVSVVSAAIIGCLGFLGVRLWNNQANNPENLITQDSQSDLSENSSTLPENPNAAMYSENLEISPALMECFYKDYLSQFESAFSYYGIDSETSLKDQMLPEEAGESISWFDYIMRQTKSTVTQLLVFNEAANADGFVLSDENKQTLEDTFADVDMNTYGDNVSEEDVHTMLEMELIASCYFNEVLENMEITDDDLNAYYQEHKTEFDTCGLVGFSVAYEEETDDKNATTEETQEQGLTKEKAQELAENLKNSKTPEEFENQVHDILITYEGYTEEEIVDLLPTIHNDSFSYTEGFDMSDWAFAEDTNVNDTYLTENDGYISVYMLTRQASLDETATVNVRHILFSTSDHTEELDEDADETAQKTASENAMKTCWELAENALTEWENGEKTEDSFAELANSYSEDPGSNTNGGLYENVYVGQMVTAFNDWCFDSSRQVGDTGLVETNYGVHVMYYSGMGEPVWKSTAKNAIKYDNMDNWYEQQQKIWAVNTNDDIISAIGD